MALTYTHIHSKAEDSIDVGSVVLDGRTIVLTFYLGNNEVELYVPRASFPQLSQSLRSALDDIELHLRELDKPIVSPMPRPYVAEDFF